MLEALRANFRDPISSLTHMAGALLAGAGLIWLAWLTYQDVLLLLTLLIYGISVIITFAASSVMHLYKGSPYITLMLVRIDHAAIYLMIAGTYTPLCYLYLDGFWRVGLLTTVWLMALGGIVYKLIRWHSDSVASTLYYVLMGTLIVAAAPEVLPRVPLDVVLMLALGGAMYLIGAVVFTIRRPNFNEWWGFHEIWHLFVLAGWAFHFLAILFAIL